MISITDKAAQQITTLIKTDNLSPETLLRVNVEKGGCSGFSYKMDFVQEINDGDKVFESNNAKVVVDSQSLLYILGMTLDFEGGLNGSGFTFNNPNASKTCGCGSSFAV